MLFCNVIVLLNLYKLFLNHKPANLSNHPTITKTKIIHREIDIDKGKYKYIGDKYKETYLKPTHSPPPHTKRIPTTKPPHLKSITNLWSSSSPQIQVQVQVQIQIQP